jgi:hypothetical protein
MNQSRFDLFVRLLAEGASRRSLLTRALMGLAIPAAMTRLVLPDAAAKQGGKRKKKVTICRAGLTVTVSKKALKKHLRHGATLGACPAAAAPPAPSPTPPPPPSPLPVCTPDCAGRSCGGDGCGGGCGTCQVNEICTNGRCQLSCPSDQAPCFGVCIPASCQSQCNEPCRVIGSGCCGPLTCQRAQTGQVSCQP